MKIYLEDFGQDLTIIELDSKQRIVACNAYEHLLKGKWVINGFTNDNQTGQIQIGEPIYYIDSIKDTSYSRLTDRNGRQYKIESIEN